MINIICPVCKNTQVQEYYNDKITNLLLCKKCGHIFNENKKIIQSKTFKDVFLESGTYSPKEYEKKDEEREFNKYWTSSIQECVNKKDITILDIGCATGNFLCAAKKKKWQTYGVEISAWASEKACKYGKIFTGTLHEAKYPSSFFDVIRISHVFLHVDNLQKEFSEIHRVLKKDGYLFIEEPNAKWLKGRFFLQGNIIRRKRWQCDPSILNYFTPNSLKTILILSKFNVEKIKLESMVQKERQKIYFSTRSLKNPLIRLSITLLNMTKVDVITKTAFFIIAIAKKNS